MPQSHATTSPFGILLRDALLSSQISQAELGRRIEQHESYISRLVQGRRTADPQTCLKIANALGIDPNPLLEAAGWLPHGYRLGDQVLAPEVARLLKLLPRGWQRKLDNLDKRDTQLLRIVFNDDPPTHVRHRLRQVSSA